VAKANGGSMQKVKRFFKRVLVWFGMMQMKPALEVQDIIKRNVKIEEQEACEHKHLVALFKNDIWYQCRDCNQVWIITDAMTLNAKALPKLIKRLDKIDKKNNKKKTYSISEASKSKSSAVKDLAKKVSKK